ncbi:MAG: SUMF1/EgtB/PvdO family nonheme iron enzyme [Candidatus Latescibacteria bacterium]|nr:SUMF1/EgtB/PvdO family nonheme iron enzyme [Candidatus Latescibacterota bacterium]
MNTPVRFIIVLLILSSVLWVVKPTAVGSSAPALIHLTLPGRTVHNSTYLAAAFLYHLQTLLGGTATSPNVMKDPIILRKGTDLYLDLTRAPRDKTSVFRQIATQHRPDDEMSLDEIQAYLKTRYYELTRPYPTLQALLRDHPYRNNSDWLTVPVDSETFFRRRVLRINKDRVVDALIAYFDNHDRLIYPEGTVIVAESLDKQGRFVEAEVLRKRGDTFWNFAVYDSQGRLIRKTIAFDENGNPGSESDGFIVPDNCAVCHRIDRLDFSGDPESPVRSPVRGFFHRLPGRVPQIHLGPEYYDHMAFTELTETSAKLKDGVFGVYGSLLLSELVGRKRLGTLTLNDRVRYRRLRPHYPELLTPLERIDSVVNSIGMKLVRIPLSKPGDLLGSRAIDPEHRPDEYRHPATIRRPFFMGMYKITNAQFRRFNPRYHSPKYRGIDLDGNGRPVVNVGYADVQAFIRWLNALPAERAAGRTYRLPTEEEWEYAAKGGDDRRFPWGDQWPPPDGSGNFSDETTAAVFTKNWEFLHGYRDGYAGTSPVGTFFPNSYFLYDMTGNAYEWTSSFYERYPNAPAGEVPYGRQMRVIRGSSWADELPKVLRCAFRLPVKPETKMEFLGFRLVAEIPSLR